jgi:hypothetical protein
MNKKLRRNRPYKTPCSFCGGIARYHFKTGKQSYCCENNIAKCPAIKLINSQKAKERPGRPHSEETKAKIRESNLGQKRSEETKAKLRKPKSEEHKAKLRKPKSEEHRKRLRFVMIGKVPWNKGKRGQVPWNKGKPRSEETKKKISETRRQRLAAGLIVITEETKRKAAESRRGRQRSLETRQKMSLAATGERSSQWKGGISCEPYCGVWNDKDFKESIKERDEYICQNPDCWGKCNKLCIHHINYDKKNCTPSNLITVCVSCNFRANKDRKRNLMLYQNIMTEKYGYAYDVNKAA